MKDFLKSYFDPNSDTSSRRVNGLLILMAYIGVSIVGIFSTWVKNQHLYDVFSDVCTYIMVAITVGVSATEAFDKFRRKKQADPEPAPAPPAPNPTVEPVTPAPPVTPVPATDPKVVNLDFIKKHEGVKLDAYRCPGGIFTIGAGSTFHPDGRPVKKGDSISAVDVDKYLTHEAATRLAQMNLPDWMNANQKTALLSWQYNCGQGAWLKSELRRLVLARAPEEQIRKVWTSKYITAKGKKLPGLVKRRQDEVDLYFTPM